MALLTASGLTKHLIRNFMAYTKIIGFGGSMALCGKDNQFRMRQDFFNGICIGKRANHIISSMKDRNRNVFKGRQILQNLILFDPTIVYEIVIFNRCNCKCLLFIKSILGGRDQARNASFKTPPRIGIGLCRGSTEFLLVVAYNGLPICMTHVRGNHRDVLLPLFGKDMRDTPLSIEPCI